MTSERTSIRQRRILDLLAVQSEATVAELVAQFKVTAMTIRRDLDALAGQGRITRTHGGAMIAAPSVAAFAFQARRQLHMQEKRAIAREAVSVIAPGMTVILDTGTTTLELARVLAGVANLRVLTSSLAIASVLFAHDGIDVVLLGGTVCSGSPDLTGALTESNLDGFHADLAFVGADGVNVRGLFSHSQAIANVSRAMIASAGRTILVADSSKFGQSAFVRFASWKDLDTVIVDGRISTASCDWVGKAVKRVIKAKV